MKLRMEFQLPEEDDSPLQEAFAVRAFKRVHGRIARYGFPQEGELPVRDDNGNVVGKWSIEKD